MIRVRCVGEREVTETEHHRAATVLAGTLAASLRLRSCAQAMPEMREAA